MNITLQNESRDEQQNVTSKLYDQNATNVSRLQKYEVINLSIKRNLRNQLHKSITLLKAYMDKVNTEFSDKV